MVVQDFQNSKPHLKALILPLTANTVSSIL